MNSAESNSEGCGGAGVSFSSAVITVGHLGLFELIIEQRGFGVYRLHPKISQETFVIAKVPAIRVTEFVPATATTAFATAEEAIAAMNRWVADPPPPRPVRKPKAALGSCRRNGHRAKFRGDGAGQMFLNLEAQKEESRAPISRGLGSQVAVSDEKPDQTK
jgi:hypothetical protein